MHAKKVEYIPGIGIDTKRFVFNNYDVNSKRAEFGITEKDVMLISIGELNDNKNHEFVVRAISKMDNERIHYFIAGKGEKEHFLEMLAKDLNVNLHLLGYRTDVVELLNCSDVYVFPSKREGLSVALMEAMAAGLPCVVSCIRGNVDLIEEGKGGYLFKLSSIDGLSNALKKLLENKKQMKKFGRYNQEIIKKFDVCRVMNSYERLLNSDS